MEQISTKKCCHDNILGQVSLINLPEIIKYELNLVNQDYLLNK
jgi:hypothetical protein